MVPHRKATPYKYTDSNHTHNDIANYRKTNWVNRRIICAEMQVRIKTIYEYYIIEDIFYVNEL